MNITVVASIVILATLRAGRGDDSSMIECPSGNRICYQRSYWSGDACNYTFVTEECACAGNCKQESRSGGDECRSLQCWKTGDQRLPWYLSWLLYSMASFCGGMSTLLVIHRRIVIAKVEGLVARLRRTGRSGDQPLGETEHLNP